ncbi:MAG: hypothetical protein QG670_258 [Thermoproteota archaeon]|nr:hypothetical protein [Thermoproteota archaeon]
MFSHNFHLSMKSVYLFAIFYVSSFVLIQVLSMTNMFSTLFPTMSTYAIIVGTYLGIRIILHLFNKSYTKPYEGLATIVIPVYQEDSEVFKKCLESCIQQKPYEIIVVDDGSKDIRTSSIALDYAEKYSNFIVVRNEKNMGKRHAQSIAFTKARGEIIVTVDSDTVLEENALNNLLSPFNDPKIGASTGLLSALNKDTNYLTKILNIRYMISGLLERAAYSHFGVVTCASGPLSGYRRSLVLPNIEEYTEQTHRGKKCTFGDDRHLTNIILKSGYSVVFQKTAKAKTIVPSSLREFAIQQLRWNRSFWRENWIISHWMWKRSKYLTLGTIMDSSLPFIYLGSLVWNLFRGIGSTGLLFLVLITVTPIVMAFIRNYEALRLVDAGEYAITPLYAWIYLLLLLPINMYALFTTDRTGWGTR